MNPIGLWLMLNATRSKRNKMSATSRKLNGGKRVTSVVVYQGIRSRVGEVQNGKNGWMVQSY
jgi:hypothetical protein